MATTLWLSAPGLNGRDLHEIGWEFVCRKCLNIHFHQAHEGTTKIRFRVAAAISRCSFSPGTRGNRHLAMSTVEGKSAAYVCENFTCKAPVTDSSKLAELLAK